MKIWLDDQWDDPETPARHPPAGWYPFKSPKKVIYLIKINLVDEISFDHDLGEKVLGNGATIAKCIEKRAFQGKGRRIKWSIHSQNPIGALNIRRAMEAAEKYWLANGI